jgi:hypothetical protein
MFCSDINFLKLAHSIFTSSSYDPQGGRRPLFPCTFMGSYHALHLILCQLLRLKPPEQDPLGISQVSHETDF